MKKFALLLATLTAAAVFPAAASAHDVVGATANCTSASVSFANFSAQQDTNVAVTVKEGGVPITSATVGSFAGSKTVSLPIVVGGGNHTLTIVATWKHNGYPQTDTRLVDVTGCPVPPPTVVTQIVPGPVQTITVQSPPQVRTVRVTRPARTMKCERRFNSKHRLVTVCKKPRVKTRKSPVVVPPHFTG